MKTAQITNSERKQLPTIDLNSADRKLLTQLPGIAKNNAFKIINFREQHGGFRDWATVERALKLPAEKLAAIRQRAVLGARSTPLRKERKVISRWMAERPNHVLLEVSAPKMATLIQKQQSRAEKTREERKKKHGK